jgi:hypothetical protein
MKDEVSITKIVLLGISGVISCIFGTCMGQSVFESLCLTMLVWIALCCGMICLEDKND